MRGCTDRACALCRKINIFLCFSFGMILCHLRSDGKSDTVCKINNKQSFLRVEPTNGQHHPKPPVGRAHRLAGPSKACVRASESVQAFSQPTSSFSTMSPFHSQLHSRTHIIFVYSFSRSPSDLELLEYSKNCPMANIRTLVADESQNEVESETENPPKRYILGKKNE